MSATLRWTWPMRTSGSIGTLIRSFVVTLVVKYNVDEQKNAGAGGSEEKKDRQSGITPDAERCFDPHQHGRADDERRDNQSHRDPVRHFLETDHERFLVDGVD